MKFVFILFIFITGFGVLIGMNNYNMLINMVEKVSAAVGSKNSTAVNPENSTVFDAENSTAYLRQGNATS